MDLMRFLFHHKKKDCLQKNLCSGSPPFCPQLTDIVSDIEVVVIRSLLVYV